MSKMKEAIMDINTYIFENMEEFFAPEDMPLDDDVPDVVENFISNLDEDVFFEILEKAKGN